MQMPLFCFALTFVVHVSVELDVIHWSYVFRRSKGVMTCRGDGLPSPGAAAPILVEVALRRRAGARHSPYPEHPGAS